jgi:hypothetical protein
VTQSQEQLIEQSQNGCLDSFGILYRHYFGSMVALAYSTTGDIHAAEDAAQETFAIACRDLRKLRNKDKFAGWFVPYEIRFKDGTVKKHNLGVRDDNPAKRYVVDGGI